MTENLDLRYVPPILFQRMTADGSDIDWAKWLEQLFDLTPILQGLMPEAEQKDCFLLVNVSLVEKDEIRREMEEPEQGPGEEPLDLDRELGE